VAASSVNQIDIKIRGGLPIGPDLPAVLGADVAGVVEAVGDGVIWAPSRPGFCPARRCRPSCQSAGLRRCNCLPQDLGTTVR